MYTRVTRPVRRQDGLLDYEMPSCPSCRRTDLEPQGNRRIVGERQGRIRVSLLKLTHQEGKADVYQSYATRSATGRTARLRDAELPSNGLTIFLWYRTTVGGKRGRPAARLSAFTFLMSSQSCFRTGAYGSNGSDRKAWTISSTENLVDTSRKCAFSSRNRSLCICTRTR